MRSNHLPFAPRCRVVRSGLVCLLAALGLNLSSSFARAQTAPPDSIRERMASEVGTWIADNAAYRSEDEPFDAYALEWSWGHGERTLVGRLYGIEDGEPTPTFWAYRVFWHPGQEAVIAQQFGVDGSFGSGRLIYTQRGSNLSQTFWAPDGSTRQERHVTEHLENQRRGLSLERVDGRWEPRRSYVWVRQPEEDARGSDARNPAMPDSEGEPAEDGAEED